MKRIFTAALGLSVCGTFSSRAAELDDGGLDVVKVRPNFYMIAGAGGNIGVQIGSDGVVLVNAGNAGGNRPGPGGAQETDRAADPIHHRHRTRTRISWAATKSLPKPD